MQEKRRPLARDTFFRAVVGVGDAQAHHLPSGYQYSRSGPACQGPKERARESQKNGQQMRAGHLLALRLARKTRRVPASPNHTVAREELSCQGLILKAQ